MAFEVKITLQLDLADRVLAMLGTPRFAVGNKAEQSAEKAEIKPGRKATPAKEQPAAKDDAASGADGDAPDGTPDYDALRNEARKALQALNKANGIDAVKEALAELEVANISAVPDEKLEQAIEIFKSKVE